MFAFVGNIKLLSLSDAVKLTVVGNIEVPGAIIHLLKKTSLVRGLQV